MSSVESSFPFVHSARPVGAGKKNLLARLLGSPGGRRGLAVLAVLALCTLLAFQPSYAAEEAVGGRQMRPYSQVLVPVIEQANRRVLADRRRLQRMALADRRSPSDRIWLEELAARYQGSPDGLDELLARVDVIPPSLAMIGAALRRGPDAVRVTVETAGTGRSHVIEALSHPIDPVIAYMHDLNRRPAYAKFRRRRADLRLLGLPVTAAGLASSLTPPTTEHEIYDSVMAVD